MPRLLLTWLQIHPGIDRVEIGAALAKDSLDHQVTRRWEPDTSVKVEDLDAALAKNPPSSTKALLEIAAGLVARESGQPTSVQLPPPPPEPVAEVEGAAPTSARSAEG